MRWTRRLCLLPLLLIPALSHAGVQLVVDGVDDELKAAVVAGVNLSQYASRDISEAQVQRLYDRADAQVGAALQPYGYYEAHTSGKLEKTDKGWRVTLHVTPGQPVIVTSVDVQLDSTATSLAPIKTARRAIERLKGKRLDDGAYEQARDGLNGTLTANGYLDARLTVHRVEVNRGEHSAAIHLAWDVGTRYRYGQVHFDGSQFRPGFLDRYVPFKSGDYFNQDQLLKFQQALNGADYFSAVNVMPQLDTAKNGIVDIDVQLAPAKRTIYTSGLFVGTDTGVGVRGGMERRWVNRYGHKWKNDIVLAQRLKTVTSQYTIPLSGDNERSLNFGATYRDANTITSQSRTLELVANESEIWRGWVRTFGVHALTGTFTVGKTPDEPASTPGVEHGSSTLVYAEGSLVRKQADNFDFVRRGWSVSIDARSTAGDLLSSARFSEITVDARWIRAFWRNNRLILRGSLGHVWTDDFDALPPQLRFFAGGDQSIRGYSFQSLGPQNSYGRVIGGDSMVIASATLEHYFTPRWGIATFVDAGNAYNGTNVQAKIGTGVGVRWRSPVGLIRVDVGTPINDAQRHGVELHLVIGPDL
ncbi:autotransporter assembly complex protein TamA [Dyella caseinilytica]|uniref:Translocation and assembly module subunit TamA n=1 Tax=Dyella caseinilytica TaxID=1849581 RepID=A0ABX7GWY2_9GAMM|nr:autotransporter assembly complex family protein [Dyella caseinilytica]QRN54481.1 outer membrane protein assembly factor [Dyella caseinilytica]GFZ94565.1 outer membrane protein assembly factor [Dyella caseinilytica]